MQTAKDNNQPGIGWQKRKIECWVRHEKITSSWLYSTRAKKFANDRKNKQTNDQPVQHHHASCTTKTNLASLMPGGKRMWVRAAQAEEKSKTHAVGVEWLLVLYSCSKSTVGPTYLVPSTIAGAKRLGATFPISYLHNRALLFTRWKNNQRTRENRYLMPRFPVRPTYHRT